MDVDFWLSFGLLKCRVGYCSAGRGLAFKVSFLRNFRLNVGFDFWLNFGLLKCRMGCCSAGGGVNIEGFIFEKFQVEWKFTPYLPWSKEY